MSAHYLPSARPPSAATLTTTTPLAFEISR